ncbi:MAG: hypothetical protein QOD74_289, partial [Variibacter sp.]|nr:hypothetical protein [Variibacter sp.]
REQEKFRTKMTQAFGMSPFGGLEEHARRNMELFEQAFAMFAPFARPDGQSKEEKPQAQSGGASGTGEIDDLKRQLSDVQRRLDRLSSDDKPSS